METDWFSIRQEAITAFDGDIPHAQTEADILEVFERSPELVLAAIHSLRDEIARGRHIRSPWAVLRHNLANLQATNITATIGDDRAKQVGLAERWIINASVHCDRELDVQDELFGLTGRLKPWAQDAALVQHMLDLWRQQRPRGERVETEADERATAWKATRARIAVQQRKRALNRLILAGANDLDLEVYLATIPNAEEAAELGELAAELRANMAVTAS